MSSEAHVSTEPEWKIPIEGSISVDHARLKRSMQIYAAATILIPLAGTILAVVLLPITGLSFTDITLCIVMFILTSLGITVGFHRHFAHRSFKAVSVVRAALGIFGCMAAQGTLTYWVAVHRRHHQFSEDSEDPHSPYVFGEKKLGFWKGLYHSHVGWMLDSDLTNTATFTKDLIRDPLVTKISKFYLIWVVLGLAIPAAIGGVISGNWMGALTGLLWGGFVRMFVVHHLMWTSGSTAHIFGTKPFETNDEARNNFILALPNLGEAWHNNHHAFPWSAMFGLRWWELDPGAWSIRTMESVGLVWDVKRPSRQHMDKKYKSRASDPITDLTEN